MVHKEPCLVCGEDTSLHMLSVADINKTACDKQYICYRCHDRYLDDNQVDCVLERSSYNGKPYYLNKIIIIDADPKSLYAYYHRLWSNYLYKFESRVWYNSSLQETVDKACAYLNRPKTSKPSVFLASSKQINYVHGLIKANPVAAAAVCESCGFTSEDTLTSQQAHTIIGKLRKEN